MSELLREGKRIPAFSAKTVRGLPFSYQSLLRKKRIIVLSLAKNPGAGDNGREWLKTAREAAGELRERDLEIIVLAEDPAQIAETENLPAPPFVVLPDKNGVLARKIGGAPAFYLVGKDTGIKQATRACPTLSVLFRQIDSMPMRRQEMQDRKR